MLTPQDRERARARFADQLDAMLAAMSPEERDAWFTRRDATLRDLALAADKREAAERRRAITAADAQLPAAHRLTVTVAFAVTPAGLATYARRHDFGATPADHATALEHLAQHLPDYVDTGLYREPNLEPAFWHVGAAT
jgi:hypothetical protein